MPYTLERTIDPLTEPLTLDQVKAQCRLDLADTTEDALLGIYIQAAREYVEGETGRALLRQTWVLKRDRFPGRFQELWAASGFYPLKPIRLPRGKVLQIVSVQYFDTANVLQTLSPAAYIAATGECGQIVPAPGNCWPTTCPRPDAVQVTYAVGYGATGASVPASLQMACLLLVAHFYENREATQAALTGNGPLPLPLGVADLLMQETDVSLSYE